MPDWGYAIDRGFAVSRVYFNEHPEAVHAMSEQGYTPLGWAAWQGQVDTVSLLLDLGADRTPEAAVVLGQKSVVADMLATDPSLAGSYRLAGNNFPLLWFAAIGGDIENADLLLLKGADVNAGGGGVSPQGDAPMGITPLHGAAEFGHVTMIEFLISQGARVNATGKFGLTPLHQAAYRGHQEAAAALISHGADISARTRDMETPLDKALQQGHTGLADWLRTQGV